MKDQPDLQELARSYMDLWQDHLVAVSKDESTAETLAKSLAMMNSGVATFAATMAAAAKSEKAPDAPQPDPPTSHAETTEASSPAKSADRAAPPALSSGHPDAVVNRLLERIAALEKRVAELEQSGPAPGARKARTRKPAKS